MILHEIAKKVIDSEDNITSDAIKLAIEITSCLDKLPHTRDRYEFIKTLYKEAENDPSETRERKDSFKKCVKYIWDSYLDGMTSEHYKIYKRSKI